MSPQKRTDLDGQIARADRVVEIGVDELACIDEDHLHPYLESSNPANISLYRRHGFEVIREVRVGGSPPSIPMLRPPC